MRPSSLKRETGRNTRFSSGGTSGFWTRRTHEEGHQRTPRKIVRGCKRGLQLCRSPNRVAKHRCAAPAPVQCSRPLSQNLAQSPPFLPGGCQSLQHLMLGYLQHDVRVPAACAWVMLRPKAVDSWLPPCAPACGSKRKPPLVLAAYLVHLQRCPLHQRTFTEEHVAICVCRAQQHSCLPQCHAPPWSGLLPGGLPVAGTAVLLGGCFSLAPSSSLSLGA